MQEGLWIDIAQRKPVDLRLQLSCKPGRTLALFGASGSGKTSTLRAIAGLSRPTAGRIYVDGLPWFDADAGIRLPVQERSVGLVFQEYALFPHLSVLENLLAAMGHVPDAERTARAESLLHRVHLTGLERRRPAELSGGQRQRVAVARALAREPRVLLLDEPFSAVDAAVRKSLYQELIELRRVLSIPIVLVTHDFQEVLRFADTVAILEDGRVSAQGTLDEICRRDDLPLIQAQGEVACAFDARVVSQHPERGLTELAVGMQPIFAPAVDVPPDARVRVRVLARDVILAKSRLAGVSIHNQLAGEIAKVVELSDRATVAVYVSIAGSSVIAHVTRDALRTLSLSVGSPVFVLIKAVAIDLVERAPHGRTAR